MRGIVAAEQRCYLCTSGAGVCIAGVARCLPLLFIARLLGYCASLRPQLSFRRIWAGNVSPAYLSTYGIPSVFSYLFPTKFLTFSFFGFILFLNNKEGS